MLKISRESEINLINVLIDNDVISGKDLISIKKNSTEGNKSQIEAVFDLKLTDEDKILQLLVKEQNLDVQDLSKIEISDDIFKENKSILEDLIVAAHNNAKLQLKSKTSEEISKATGGFGIPGFKWPL